MMPYGVGMYLAYEYLEHKEKKAKYERNCCSLFLEVFSLVTILGSGWIGVVNNTNWLGTF